MSGAELVRTVALIFVVAFVVLALVDWLVTGSPLPPRP